MPRPSPHSHAPLELPPAGRASDRLTQTACRRASRRQLATASWRAWRVAPSGEGGLPRSLAASTCDCWQLPRTCSHAAPRACQMADVPSKLAVTSCLLVGAHATVRMVLLCESSSTAVHFHASPSPSRCQMRTDLSPLQLASAVPAQPQGHPRRGLLGCGERAAVGGWLQHGGSGAMHAGTIGTAGRTHVRRVGGAAISAPSGLHDTLHTLSVCPCSVCSSSSRSMISVGAAATSGAPRSYLKQLLCMRRDVLG